MFVGYTTCRVNGRHRVSRVTTLALGGFGLYSRFLDSFCEACEEEV